MEARYLFKAKRVDNGEWIIGNLIQSPFLSEMRTWISSEQEDKTRLRSISKTQALWRAIEVDTSTLCQCTGLKDKNGKLIFENDIVCHEYNEYADDIDFLFEQNRKRKNYVIKWDSTTVYCGFRYHNGRNIFPLINGTVSNGNDDVIGNIFDNPELINKKKKNIIKDDNFLER